MKLFRVLLHPFPRVRKLIDLMYLVYARCYSRVFFDLRTVRGWAVFPHVRLYSFVISKLRKDIEFVGKSSLWINPSTRLIMHNSRIVIQDGAFMIGLYVGGVMGGEYDPKRDNCRINLHNSVILSIGNVSLTPGCRIVAIDGELVIRRGTMINGPTSIFVRKKVEIGEYCIFARGVTIMDTDWHKHAVGEEKPKENAREVIIQDRCWIGQNAMILKGVKIGEGSIVAANSVVTRDVPPRTMVAGNPARVIKENVVWEL